MGVVCGFGLVFVEVIVVVGVRVVMVDILQDMLVVLVLMLQQCGLVVEGFLLDLVDFVLVQFCVQVVIVWLGGFDGLVNNVVIINFGGKSSE